MILLKEADKKSEIRVRIITLSKKWDSSQHGLSHFLLAHIALQNNILINIYRISVCNNTMIENMLVVFPPAIVYNYK